MLLTKLLVTIFGKSEFVFRAIPFMSSLFSLILLYLLCIKCLPRKFVIFPVFLVATSPSMLRYATEFKQYSSDVLIAIIIALYVLSILKSKYTLKTGITFGAIGAVAIWFSFPSVFMLGGAGAVLFVSYLLEKKHEDAKNLVVSLLFWGVSFMLIYLFFLKDIGGRPSLKSFWDQGFMPLPPFTIKAQFWFVHKALEIFYHPGMMRQALIGLIAFIVGAYAFYKEKKKICLFMLLPLLFTLIASSIQKYPFKGRVLLFYVPFLYIFVARGVTYLIYKRSYFFRAIGIVFFLSILFPAAVAAYDQFIYRTVYREEIKPVLNYVKQKRKKEDFIYVYCGAEKAFEFYSDLYGFNKSEYIQGIISRNNWEKYRTDIDQFKGKKRVWFIFTHVNFSKGSSEEKYMVDYMETIGKRIESFHAVQAAGYLFDFSNGS